MPGGDGRNSFRARPGPLIQSQGHARAPYANSSALPRRRSLRKKDRRSLAVTAASPTPSSANACERLAFGLLSEGVLPGDRVAYLSFNTHQLLEGYFAAPLVRAIVMPLNVRLTAAGADLHPQSRRTARPGLRGRFRAPRGTLAAGLPRRAALGRSRRRLRGTPLRAAASSAPMSSPSTKTKSPSCFTPPAPPARRRASCSRTAPCTCTCSPSRPPSTTTRPCVELHTIPLFHANGWGRPQCATFHGLKQVMVRRFDPAHVLRLIQEEKATSMSLVPTMANALLNCPETRQVRRLQHAPDSSGRRGLLAGADRAPGSRIPLPRDGRLRPHRNRARRHQRARQVHRAALPTRRTACATAPWPAGRCRAARSASWTFR